jgi:pimeloyl-ACP methyl ester carboxylesterase
VTLLLEGLAGPGWRALVDGTAPGAVAQAVVDAPAFFASEGPSLGTWQLPDAAAAEITAPVLSVKAAGSPELFAEGRALLHRWFPHCADADVDGAGHLMVLQRPAAVAAAVASFALAASVASP